jgi:predicted nucleotidyltransferase
MTEMEKTVPPPARTLARRLIAEGADAVVLLGSYARGEAHPESDIDLYALGDGPDYLLERWGGSLVSISWRKIEVVRASFLDPRQAGGAVPGWRDAVPLEGPHGLARALIEEASRWTRDLIPSGRWKEAAAEDVTGLAEEVHKLVISLERGRLWTAAVQRSILALRPAGRMAVYFGLLYRTENELWDLVADRMGDRWRTVQGRALGTGGEDFPTTCRAALELYALAAAAMRDDLSEDQWAVVAHACALAGYPLDTPR